MWKAARGVARHRSHCQREQKRTAHLFEALLADGLRVDLHLEDDGVGLTDEAPHLRSTAFESPSGWIPRRCPAARLPTWTNMHFRRDARPDVYDENDPGEGDSGEDKNDGDDDNDGLSFSGYAAGRRPVVPGGTFFVITKLQTLRTRTAVTATGSGATTTCDVGNVLALVPETECVSSTSISRRGMAHALTARRRRGSVREIESPSGRSIEWR